MVAGWGGLSSLPYLKRAFGLGQGRIVSRYPKNWAKRVWQSFSSDSDMDKKRLEELLVRLNETMIKRKDCCWDDTKGTWLENALLEHARHPFFTIMARNNPKDYPEIIVESDLDGNDVKKWDIPHGLIVPRQAVEMTEAIEMALSRCRWVKFIDPYISTCRPNYKQSLEAFFTVLGSQRPVGSPELIEIHTNSNGASKDFLIKFFQKLIPSGLTATLYLWQEKSEGEKLHNRFILTDLGGVSFHHGLDTGTDGETDDLSLLYRDQYNLRCGQYCLNSPAFDLAETPVQIKGSR